MQSIKKWIVKDEVFEPLAKLFKLYMTICIVRFVYLFYQAYRG